MKFPREYGGVINMTLGERETILKHPLCTATCMNEKDDRDLSEFAGKVLGMSAISLRHFSWRVRIVDDVLKRVTES